MLPPKDFGSPEEHTPLRINLAKRMIGWEKYRRKSEWLFGKISENVVIGILLVVCILFLPIIGPLYLIDCLIGKYNKYKHKAAVQNGILTNELSASQKTTVYLSSRDVSGSLGTTDIEYSQSTEKASFNSQNGNGRYRVYGTREEGLFMLVPVHRKVYTDWLGGDSYYQCEVVRVNGGYNHGYFEETSPMGSNDCVVLVYKKASKTPPSKDLIVITASSDNE